MTDHESFTDTEDLRQHEQDNFLEPEDYPSQELGEKGETVGVKQADGTIKWEFVPDSEKEPRFNLWKNARKIMESPDDRVKRLCENAHGIYFSVCGSTVLDRGNGHGKKHRFLCLKTGHICNKCPHTIRLERYRAEHPTEVAA